MSFSPKPYNAYIWSDANGRGGTSVTYVTTYIAISNIIFTPTGFVINANYSYDAYGSYSDLTRDELLYYVYVNGVDIAKTSGDFYRSVFTVDTTTITSLRVYMYIKASAYEALGPIRYEAAASIDSTISNVNITHATNQYTIMRTFSPVTGAYLTKVCFILLPPSPVTGQLVTIKSREGNITYVYSNTTTIDDTAYNTNVTGLSCVVLTSKNAITLLYVDTIGWQIVGFVGSS
jgi:hypothetical protein